MSEFEPSRILNMERSNLNNVSSQQYLEVGSNTFIGTKDGIKYTLLPTADNQLKLCEVLAEADPSILTSLKSWSSSTSSSIDVEDNFTAYKNPSKKLITPKKEATPCLGQGDESGNSIIISTPDSTSRYKNFGNNISEESSESLAEEQYKLGETTKLTYTTLLPKHNNSENNTIPITYFQFSQPLQSPIFTKATRGIKTRFKTPQISLNRSIPYPELSPIFPQKIRGQRQRRPRQASYRYQAPQLHSTPTSASSSKLNDNSPMPSLNSTLNSSIITYNESQTSLDYPRVPNNTPISGEISVEDKKKVFDIQWMPQIQNQFAEYEHFDSRETHNEKERKRRLRIKTACQTMKSLLPGVCNKTDNATVFENAVHFIAFMRESMIINDIKYSDCDIGFIQQT